MKNILQKTMLLGSLVILSSCNDDDLQDGNYQELENINSSSRQLSGNETLITEDGNSFDGNANEASNWGEGLDKLNDGNYYSKYFVQSGEVDVSYIPSTPLVPSSYILVSGNDSNATYRDPSEWTIYGYYNNQWEVIDSQNNQIFQSRHSSKEYFLNTSKAYTSYYFSFKTNSSQFELGEIQIVSSTNDTPINEAPFPYNYSNYNQYKFSYENYNGVGSRIFRNNFTTNRVKNLLNDKAEKIANLLYNNSSEISSKLKLNEFKLSKDDGAAWSIGNGGDWNEYGCTIWLSEKYVEEYYNSLSYNDFLKEIDGVIVHEMVHTLSIGHNNGNNDSSQYVEGIADYCRIKLGYRSPSSNSGVHKPVSSSSIHNADAYNIAWFLLYLEKYKDTNTTKKIVKYYTAHTDFTWNAAMNHIGLNLDLSWNQFINYIDNGGNL